MSQASGAHAYRNELAVKSFTRPEDTRTFEKGRMDVITAGGVTFGRGHFEPGWKWSTCVKPIAKTESCQATHLGYQVSGRMHVVMDDGTEKDIGPGEVCSIPPGHDAWVVGNEPVVIIDIAGAADYAKPR
ncbi:MAG TPA: cupin domain-containing protein [Bryobacteraceae bacterium]|nr:cupin domain-containing protein [Bryobacteraceae bacterium]